MRNEDQQMAKHMAL